LLGGKGSKASKEAAADEPAPTGSGEGKEEEPSAQAVTPEQGQGDSSDVIPGVENRNSGATRAATATAGETAAAVTGAPSSPVAAAAAAAAAAMQAEPPQPPPQQQKQAEQQPLSPPKPKGPQAEVNYAAEKAGAVVLQSSSSLVGAKNLLDDDKDKYARSPCAESKWVIINLSEDIRIHALVLANYEKFSSMVKDFQVWYSVQCPSLDGEEDSEGWLELGTFQAREKTGEQRFVVDPPRYARYLKVRLVSHWSREFYCTLSQIKVLGSTLQQGFMDDWQKQKLNIGSQLEAIDPAAVDGGSSSSSSSNHTCLADGTCVAQEEGKQAAEGIEVELPLSSSSSSSGSSTDGVDGNVPKAGGEGGGEAPPPAAGNDPGTEQQSEAQPQGEHPPTHDEKEEDEKEDKGTTSHTFAEPSVPAGGSVEGEGGSGKTPSSSDEKPAAGAGEAAATEPVVLGHVPNAEGAAGSGEKMTDESVSLPPPPTPERGKNSSRGEKEKEKEGAAAGEPAAGPGEVHKKDGAPTREKPPAPAAESPPQDATAQNGASTPPPLLPSPTPVAPASDATTAEGEPGGKKQDIPERNATADLAPAAAAAAAAATTPTGGTATDSSNPDEMITETTTATPVLNEEGVVTPVPAAEAAPPPPSPPGITPTPTTTATVVATVSGAPAKTELMSRFRHQCLQQMRLGDFKKQKLAKLQEDLRAKGGGAAATSSLGSGSPYDNIFKTLMDEMTSLEINQSIFDVYVSNLHSCFVQVVDDVLLEQDRARLEAGETIGALQGRLQNQATVNEQLLHRMHRLENSFLVGALAWLIVLAFLVLLACAQVVAWKRLRRTAAEVEEQEQQPEQEKQN